MSCLACKHYQSNSKCPAFPDRIPTEIIAGAVRHNEIYPGQTGSTVFEPGTNPVNEGIVEFD